MLKIEEASWLPAAIRDLETFLHGHLPATGPDTSLVLVLTERAAPTPRAKRARQALAASIEVGMRPAAILGCRRRRGDPRRASRRAAGSSSPDAADQGAAGALLGAAAPLQLVTLAIAAARGTNPDLIRREDERYLRAADVADAPDA